MHARKAWLQGLSPKQNREVPPLDYARVYRLKAAHPELTIVLNGGIENLDAAAMHLEHVDGVMLGRAAYQTPYILAEVDRRFFEAGAKVPTRAEAIEGLIPHIERHLAAGGRLNNVVRHVLGLYHGERAGARVSASPQRERTTRRCPARNALRGGLHRRPVLASTGGGGIGEPLPWTWGFRRASLRCSSSRCLPPG